MKKGIRIVGVITGLLLCAPGCTGDEAGTRDDDVSGASSPLADEAGVKVVKVQVQIQQTSYWCGPAAARVAISARKSPPTQATLAQQLRTTVNGTDSILQVTPVLNRNIGAEMYRSVVMPNDPPTQAERERLWTDVLANIDNDYPIVANIVAPASNHPPRYPNYTIYHYVAIIGYNMNTKQVRVADSANFGGLTEYWLSFDQMATLIPPKGYSAVDPAKLSKRPQELPDAGAEASSDAASSMPASAE